jgi:hypothetical protein
MAGPNEPSWSSQLNVFTGSALYEFGAYFGNDQRLRMFPAGDFSRIRLSAYGPQGQCLGSVDVGVNGDTSVDQFIGIGSDTPFSQLRFENLSSSGAASKYYCVVLDNMMYSSSTGPTVLVPEPSSAGLLGLGILGFFFAHRRRRTK